MSQYHEHFKLDDMTFNVLYGHDHATGYFVSIWISGFDNEYGSPAVQTDELFGKQYAKNKDQIPERFMTIAEGYMWTLFEQLKDGSAPAEKMIRTSGNHLGHQLAKIMAKFGGVDLPESTKE